MQFDVNHQKEISKRSNQDKNKILYILLVDRKRLTISDNHIAQFYLFFFHRHLFNFPSLFKLFFVFPFIYFIFQSFSLCIRAILIYSPCHLVKK